MGVWRKCFSGNLITSLKLVRVFYKHNVCGHDQTQTKVGILWFLGGAPTSICYFFCPSVCLLHTLFQEPYIMWSLVLVYMCKMMISPGIFFHFFKILIFWVVKEVKGQKMVQNDNKFCPSISISQEPYITWLSFVIHMCKMIISPEVFFIFSKVWFFGLLGW